MALSEVITNYKSRRPQLEAILRTEDQASLEVDFKAFFGTNEATYVKHAQDLVAKNRLMMASWHWPAFLTAGFGWAFYRRLYRLGFALFGAQFITLLIASNPRMVVFAAILLPAYLLGLIAFAFFARSLYVGFALNAIYRANDRRIIAHKRPEYIAKLGGVSVGSGAGGLALLLLNILLLIVASQPPV